VEEIRTNFIKQHIPASLLQRFTSVDEVANMVVYVASREASATNGAELKVEGGTPRAAGMFWELSTRVRDVDMCEVPRMTQCLSFPIQPTRCSDRDLSLSQHVQHAFTH
jgi:hypothetical protein